MITHEQLQRVLRRARCTFAQHDWKRAVRQQGKTGMQKCRHCTATRNVTLRAQKVGPELVRTPTPEPIAAQRSQWP